MAPLIRLHMPMMAWSHGLRLTPTRPPAISRYPFLISGMSSPIFAVDSRALSNDFPLHYPFCTRWSNLRGFEGWAALQHHALLRTSLTIHPPSSAEQPLPPPNLLFSLTQGSYFTVVPHPSSSSGVTAEIIPEWYAGNIYDMLRGTPQTVTLPTPPSMDKPTVYDVFVSGDYEVGFCLIMLDFFWLVIEQFTQIII